MFSGSSRSGIPDSTSLTWKMNARGLRSRKLAEPAWPQPAAQLIASLRQSRADGAFGDALQAGDLAVVVAMVIAEHEIRGHARGQPGRGTALVATPSAPMVLPEVTARSYLHPDSPLHS